MARETRSTLQKLYVPGMFTVAVEEYKHYPEIWRQLVGVRSSDKAYEECSYVSGLGVVPPKAEGVAISYDKRIQGYTKRWTHDTYALGLKHTQEALEDDLYGVMSDGAREMGVSARETRHIRVAGIFNTGFGTTVHTAGDGLAVFSASHVRLDGTTWSNLQAATSLSYESLQDMILAFESQVDHRGKKIMQSPATLLVPPALEMKAMELLESVGQPGTANNDINTVKAGRPSLRVIVWPYLTSTTAHFLIGDNARMSTGLIMFERIGVTFGSSGDWETGDSMMKVRWRDSIE